MFAEREEGRNDKGFRLFPPINRMRCLGFKSCESRQSSILPP